MCDIAQPIVPALLLKSFPLNVYSLGSSVFKSLPSTASLKSNFIPFKIFFILDFLSFRLFKLITLIGRECLYSCMLVFLYFTSVYNPCITLFNSYELCSLIFPRLPANLPICIQLISSKYAVLKLEVLYLLA